ncbi:secreted phosphoprotein 24-like [Megalops cyprinoides]|uniref:secreted phosphoprotein 24-like n=1 Tax=Megalops cyprinoides TaxID=118141 RepID=UPI001864CF0C|nr:secreted phosphoprotein 24-like [Megalops cyprinoides]
MFAATCSTRARKMKPAVICLILLQLVCSSGLPLFQFDLSPLAERALNTSLTRVNGQSTGLNLFRVTRSSVKRVIPVAMNVYDIMLNFGIRETVCPKSSGSDPNQCPFSPGFFVPKATCASRVRLSADVSEILSLRCGRAGSSSSSSESSSGELMSMRMMGTNGQHGFLDRAPAPAAPTFAPRNSFARNDLSNFLE